MKKIGYILIMGVMIFLCMSVVSASQQSDLNDTLTVDDANPDEISVSENENVNLKASDDVEVLASDDETLDVEDVSDTQGDLKVDKSASKKADTVPHKLKSKKVTTTYGKRVKFTVKVLNKNKKPIPNIKVNFKIGNDVYKVKTNSKGISTLKLNRSSGNYIIKYRAGKVTGKNKYIVKNSISLKVLDWDNRGNVAKVKLLKNSMPNNPWVKKAVKATKKGIPLLTFKGGKGKTVFITAGVHGNELSSQVAAMRMIQYLSTHPIKGTVYVIPFVNIKAITKKVRHVGVDYNRFAHKSGYNAHNIVRLITHVKADAYGDFHTTKPGGAPGQNIVMGSHGPAKKSASLTRYISSKCNVNKRIYSYAGQQYPGAIADNVNKKGIPAVICEVVLPHNTLTSRSVKISYNMMQSLLKFNSVI